MSVREVIDVVAKIISVFLGTLLLFSILNGDITIFMVIGALSVTYLFIHYWEKRFLAHKNDKVK